MAYGVDKLPHIFRSIPRIVLVFLILALFSLAVLYGQRGPVVKGTGIEVDDVLESEIQKTLDVIEKRPDYAGAWIRLAVLYEQIGEKELAVKALDTAEELNPDL